jgi:uncharacterized protein YcnI
VLLATAVLTLLSAASASAHVTVNPSTATGGSFTQLTFRAANEEATARFVKLVVRLPAAQPLGSVSTLPVAGWKVSTSKAKLAKPITTDDGTATEYTAAITWTATAGGVPSDQYQNFDVSAGPLPASGVMTFSAEQTYSDGTLVRWDQTTQPGAPEPPNPAPVLTLTAASPDDSGSAPANKTSDDVARGLGIAGIVVGVAGLAAAGIALRRRGHTG